MVIIINSVIEQQIKKAFNTHLEVTAWFLGHYSGTALNIEQIISSTGQENNVSSVTILPQEWINRAKTDSCIEIVSGHFHSRPEGMRIAEFDPYWTITVNEGPYSPGQIIDGRFYVSRKYQHGQAGGDSRTLESLVEFGKANRVNFQKILFVHPRYGSEKRLMHQSMIDIHCYELDFSQKYKIRELPVKIR